MFALMINWYIGFSHPRSDGGPIVQPDRAVGKIYIAHFFTSAEKKGRRGGSAAFIVTGETLPALWGLSAFPFRRDCGRSF